MIFLIILVIHFGLLIKMVLTPYLKHVY